MCACIGNHRSHRIIIARLRSSVQSLLHQHRDLHQSIYLYLSEDWELTPHQVVSDFTVAIVLATFSETAPARNPTLLHLIAVM
jgi:hypothetical protein